MWFRPPEVSYIYGEQGSTPDRRHDLLLVNRFDTPSNSSRFTIQHDDRTCWLCRPKSPQCPDTAAPEDAQSAADNGPVSLETFFCSLKELLSPVKPPVDPSMRAAGTSGPVDLKDYKTMLDKLAEALTSAGTQLNDTIDNDKRLSVSCLL